MRGLLLVSGLSGCFAVRPLRYGDPPRVTAVEGAGSTRCAGSACVSDALVITGEHLEEASHVRLNEQELGISDRASNRILARFTADTPAGDYELTVITRTGRQSVSMHLLPGVDGGAGEQGPRGEVGPTGAPGLPCDGCVDDASIADVTRNVPIQHCVSTTPPVFAPSSPFDSLTWVYAGGAGLNFYPGYFFGAKGVPTPVTATDGRSQVSCSFVVPSDYKAGSEMRLKAHYFAHAGNESSFGARTRVLCLAAGDVFGGALSLDALPTQPGGAVCGAVGGPNPERRCIQQMGVIGGPMDGQTPIPGSTCLVSLLRSEITLTANTMQELWILELVLEYDAVR